MKNNEIELELQKKNEDYICLQKILQEKEDLLKDYKLKVVMFEEKQRKREESILFSEEKKIQSRKNSVSKSREGSDLKQD